MAFHAHRPAPQAPLATSSTAQDSSSHEAHRSSALPAFGSATVHQSHLESSPGESHHPLPQVKHEASESGAFDPIGQEFALQPQDEGFGAWSYVAAAFSMYIVVWGFPQALPVFQSRLSVGQDAKFPNSVAITLLTPGIQDFQEGFLFHILPRHAKWRVWIVLGGITIMLSAFLLASFADTAWQVAVLHGHLFGVGGVMLNFVHVSVFSEWFDKRRSEAMGIIWLGFRVGAVAAPVLCNWMLEKHGYGQTLRVLIAPMITLLGPSLFLLRGRYPASDVVSKPVQPRTSFLQAIRQPKVLFYLTVSFLFNLSTYMPVMFITTFGADIGVKFSDAVIALTVHNAARMIGTYLSGKFIDEKSPLDMVLASFALSTAFVHLIVWGFCKSRLTLFIYAILIGITTGGNPNAFYSMFSTVAGKDERLFTAIHSIFSFASSVGTMTVGPVGALILKRSPHIDMNVFAIEKYKYLVLYAFGTNFLSGSLSLGRAFLNRQKKQSPRISDGGSAGH